MELRDLSLLWLPAARSGFASPEDWAAWAERLIKEVDHPAGWLLDLCVAQDLGAMTDALLGDYPGMPDDNSDALLGYAWLRHEIRRGPLDLVLRAAGDLADSYDASLSCEDIFKELRLLDKSMAEDERKALRERVRSLFSECRGIALEQWGQLHAPELESDGGSST